MGIVDKYVDYVIEIMVFDFEFDDVVLDVFVMCIGYDGGWLLMCLLV